ncbi:MAG: RNA 2',3'-cyclic phosphodiesterase [Planctomycetota bacterium]|nr:RNA 2',3'-cyclic phosphodiesterase [Planctomycetota bacterium]MDA1213976.1 RNA 2',3'-cyclic phosphodiesterase [Planctomycetota bacterium]
MAESSALVRSFVGVSVPALPIVNTVLRKLNAMGTAIKTVQEATLHVTLKFLGDVPADRIAPIGNAIAKSAANFSAHRIELHGIGTFPDERRPSVIWIGLKPVETLVTLASEIELAMCDFGFEPESRAFSPHLTLARVKTKPPSTLFELIEAHRRTPFGDFAVEEVKLYRSELTPGGPVYSVLKTCPLSSV